MYRPRKLRKQKHPLLGDEGALLASRIEHTICGMRTDAILHPRPLRLSWQSGYDAALRDVHERIKGLLIAEGID